MSKTRKELAFLRDLSVDTAWTVRFTDLFDANYKFTDERSIVYLNAGPGNHALALPGKLHHDASILGICEDRHLNTIASAKASAIKSNVMFSRSIPSETFDLALVDASLFEPDQTRDLIAMAVSLSHDRAAFFLPTAGSFGEIFSVLWEVCLSENLIEKSGEIAKLIKAIPTVSNAKEFAAEAGLNQIKSYLSNEVFEYVDGTEFIESTLISDFFLPVWLRFLDPRTRTGVKKRLAQTIDLTRDNMSFRFTVKAAVIFGSTN